MRNGLPYRTFPIELSLGTRGKTRGIQCEQNSRRYAGVPYTLNGQTWEWTRFPLPIRLPQRSKKLSLLMSASHPPPRSMPDSLATTATHTPNPSPTPKISASFRTTEVQKGPTY